MTARLAGSPGTVYVRQLNGGAIGENDTIRDDAAQAACLTLETLDLVGTLEGLRRFLDEFHRRFGLELNVGVERAGKARRDDVTAEQRRRIAQLCAADQEIYAHASKLAG